MQPALSAARFPKRSSIAGKKEQPTGGSTRFKTLGDVSNPPVPPPLLLLFCSTLVLQPGPGEAAQTRNNVSFTPSLLFSLSLPFNLLSLPFGKSESQPTCPHLWIPHMTNRHPSPGSLLVCPLSIPSLCELHRKTCGWLAWHSKHQSHEKKKRGKKSLGLHWSNVRL